MSGAKRRTKYRKQVESDILDSLPEPEEDEMIVEMIASRGGNLLEVRNEYDEVGLCRLPSKFRKLVWVKRGTFLIVKTGSDDFLTANGEKGKVTYTVVHILFRDQVKHLQSIGKWPEKFVTEKAVENNDTGAVGEEVHEGDSDTGSDSDDSLFQNRNRVGGGFDESDSSSDDSESENEEDQVDSVEVEQNTETVEVESNQDANSCVDKQSDTMLVGSAIESLNIDSGDHNETVGENNQAGQVQTLAPQLEQ